MMAHDYGIGFRFDPTNEELVYHYLYNRIMGNPLPCNDAVKECDLYDKEPWEVWERYAGPLLRPIDDNEDLYFFTNRKRRNGNGSRFDRTVGSGGGTWHGEDSGKPFKINVVGGSAGQRLCISWTLKRFRYENRSKKSNGNGDQWIMHEYSLDNDRFDLVLCRLRRKVVKKRTNHGLQETVMEDNLLGMVSNNNDENVGFIFDNKDDPVLAAITVDLDEIFAEFDTESSVDCGPHLKEKEAGGHHKEATDLSVKQQCYSEGLKDLDFNFLNFDVDHFVPLLELDEVLCGD